MKKQESQISDGTAELSKLKDSHIDANLASENLHTTPRANSESVKRNPLLISGIEDNESFYYTAGSTTSNQPVVVAQVREDNQKSLGSTTELWFTKKQLDEYHNLSNELGQMMINPSQIKEEIANCHNALNKLIKVVEQNTNETPGLTKVTVIQVSQEQFEQLHRQGIKNPLKLNQNELEDFQKAIADKNLGQFETWMEGYKQNQLSASQANVKEKLDMIKNHVDKTTSKTDFNMHSRGNEVVRMSSQSQQRWS